MRPISIFACLFLAAAIVPYAAAQQDQGPLVLSEIHASGSSRYSEAQLAEAAGLKPGEPVTAEQIQDAANHLAELGVFARVNYRFVNRENKVVLTLELKDAPVVPVSFDNFPWFTDAELITAIRRVAPLFGDTAPTDGAELDAMTAAIARLLSDRGVRSAVEHRLVAQAAGDSMMMQFHLDGPEVVVDSLELGDAAARDSEALRDRQHDLLKKPFSRLAVDIFEAEQILPLYLKAGNLRVRFGEPQVKFLDPGEPGKPPAAKVSLTLPIDPGPVFHLAEVKWSGVTAVPEEQLQSGLPLKSGDLADGMTLAGGWQRIEQEFTRRGYLDVKLDPRASYDDAAGAVSYEVAVTQGPQYRMGELVLTGLSVPAEKALKTAWTVQRGAVFDAALYDKMLTLLARPNTQIFGEIPVHYLDLSHFLRTDPQKHTVDVLLDFK